jgi:hypothetical protein
VIAERWRRGIALGLTLMLAAGAAPAAKITERTRQKQAAETERAALQQKLSALKRDINQTESA